MPAGADPLPEPPGWYAAETANWLASTGRTQDQLSNPEYAALRAGQADTDNADPCRAPERRAPGDPQGAGASDTAPAARHCDPHGDWRRPQEMGVTETQLHRRERRRSLRHDRGDAGCGAAGGQRSHRPRLIRGVPIPDALSGYYVSQAAFDGHSCADLRRRVCAWSDPAGRHRRR